tara:strand:+ start:1264 stop:1704 length:441 start_codon:yes stop_codon:yes gene_type:complete
MKNGNGAPKKDGRKNNGQHEAFKSKQWKKGQSGNPKGRPKGKTLSEEIKAMLHDELKGGDGLTHLEAIARVMVKEALKGKFPFAKEILERTEGKVADKTELTGASGDPIEILDLSSKDRRADFYRLLSGATDSSVERSSRVRYNGE